MLFALAALLSAPLSAAAAASPLRTLSDADVANLVPLLEGGEVVLIESKGNGHLRQVTLFALANATPKQILDVVADAPHYPKFISNIDYVKVLQTSGKRTKVQWQLSTPIVTISGVNQVFDARPDHIRYTAVEGDLRTGFWRWEAVPVDEGRRSVAVLYTYADLRDSHWLLQKLIEIRPDLEHSAVITGNLVQLKGILNEAERRAGTRSGSRRPAMGRWRPAKLKSVAPLMRGDAGKGLRGLLARGEVALIRSRKSGRLEQAILLAVVDRPADEVRAVVADVERYAEFMPTVEEIEVRERSGEHVKYNAHYDIPLFSMEVETELKPVGKHRLSLKILGGDLKRGRYGWEFLPLDGGKRTLALFYGNADIRSQGFLLKTLVDKEPYLEHGLNVGIQLVAVRAVDQRTIALAK
jgi:ribosome-associated toxin RatA of RatAB toxin-antitoxin module